MTPWTYHEGSPASGVFRGCQAVWRLDDPDTGKTLAWTTTDGLDKRPDDATPDDLQSYRYWATPEAYAELDDLKAKAKGEGMTNVPNSPYKVSAEWDYALGPMAEEPKVSELDALRLENACLHCISKAQQNVISQLTEKLRALTEQPKPRTPVDDVHRAIANLNRLPL